MKSKNDSCFLDEQKSNSSNNPSPKKEKKVIKSNSPSTNFQEKNNEKSQDPVEQEDFGDFNNFNISFFLPKDLRQNIEDDHDNPENKIESEGKNVLGERKDSFFPKIDNNNENCINSNYNDNIDQTECNFSKFTSNNNDNIDILKNKNIEPNYLKMKENSNGIKNYFSTNTNINTIFINNNNNTPLNFQFNNNSFFNNNFQPLNYSNFMNIPQISTNQFLCNTNINPINFFINNNGLSNLSDCYINNQPQYKNRNNQCVQNNKVKQRNKKIIDEYNIEMFGRHGWICKLCNNFNYDTRKKCNRCHVIKKPKKIVEYLLEEKNKNLIYKNFWHCKYCGNYNYSFRIICNRCQAKKEIF